MQIFFFLYIVALFTVYLHARKAHKARIKCRDRELNAALWWSEHYRVKAEQWRSKLETLEEHYGVRG